MTALTRSTRVRPSTCGKITELRLGDVAIVIDSLEEYHLVLLSDDAPVDGTEEYATREPLVDAFNWLDAYLRGLKPAYLTFIGPVFDRSFSLRMRDDGMAMDFPNAGWITFSRTDAAELMDLFREALDTLTRMAVAECRARVNAAAGAR